MLHLDDLRVESFATTSGAATLATPTTVIGPYSLLGSCYGCPGDSSVTICAATVAE